MSILTLYYYFIDKIRQYIIIYIKTTYIIKAQFYDINSFVQDALLRGSSRNKAHSTATNEP